MAIEYLVPTCVTEKYIFINVESKTDNCAYLQSTTYIWIEHSNNHSFAMFSPSMFWRIYIFHNWDSNLQLPVNHALDR